jgi:hypothetical protein
LNKKVKCPIVLQALRWPDVIHQAKYLEKQFNDAQSQLRDIVRSSFFQPLALLIVFISSSTTTRSNEPPTTQQLFNTQ